MQLGNVHVVGVGRLADASMKVRGKVTAIVGPNEAGKSTLLRAIASTSWDTPIGDGPIGGIPRRTNPIPTDVALKATFTLDAEDQAAITHIPSEQKPTRVLVEKSYGGQVSYDIQPNGRRPRAPREKAAKEVVNLLAALSKVDEDASDEVLECVQSLRPRADSALAILDGSDDPATMSDEMLNQLDIFVVELGSTTIEVVPEKERILSVLNAALDNERAPHPTSAMRSVLIGRVPIAALFGAADRDLSYEYDLNGMTEEGTPAALSNLAASAKLDLVAMVNDMAVGKWDAVAEHIEDANDHLQELFESSWTAGSGTAAVHLDRDGTTLRIMVTSKVGRYSPISERSDGLRMFVALTTFVQARTGGQRPVVLLIDEAENHLHYDAQADLMAVLGRQELAAQVIYTTHSAGCLPDELGGNIVAVVPDPESGRSTIDSSYWTSGLGFSPLMMAMGAGAAAITPSRYAVLAEGHSEALILPRLIREATGLHRLGYQIAAGVAEAGRADIPALDAEAAHVVYLVDGDQGGKNNAAKLTRAGVPSKRVIQLGGEGSGLCLEDLVKDDVYSKCVDTARVATGHEPSKTEIAAGLIDVEGDLVTPGKVDLLAALHLTLSDALDIPPERRPTLLNK
ncbi:AAA family ATPase [Rhodococcus sp. 06-1474-1B]|uniref:AAA family ATPase n=1 Tax=Rhodococcus sp. 06-1474-1B TaxID=2022499 RepID=UPI0011400217|nr:AAA family ATPase [Rhodococcus sp. 06-1474-1B]